MAVITNRLHDELLVDLMVGATRQEVQVHDHGLVALLDLMPRLAPKGKTADSAIVQAARVSYGDGTKTPTEDRGLIRYLMRHRHCYDKDTEVLTGRGFVKWPDVKPDDELGVWDSVAATLRYEMPEYLTRHAYKGDMYRVEHGGVDLLVTPDHKMWVRTKKWDGQVMVWAEPSLISANELGDRSMVRYSKLAPFVGESWDGEGMPKAACTTALLEFVGFFVGDGSADRTSRNVIYFHLKKERKLNYLRALSVRLGWRTQEWKSYGGRVKVAVYGEDLGHVCREQFYDSGQKVLPQWATRLDRDDAQSLLDGLRASDGTSKRSTWEYVTSSRRLAEQVQLVALHAGHAAHINRHGDDMYGVMFLSRMAEPVINQSSKNTSLEHYDGEVFCAKTRTGILVVRRNGKIVLSGNTTPFEMVEFKFHCVMPIFIARQWIRHRTANVNEYSARYSVVRDRFYRPTAQSIRKQSQTNRQGGEETVEDVNTATDFLAYLDHAEALYADYEKALDRGVSREMARIGLPLSTYTEWYWKIDLHNLFHFLSLRMDRHAQQEIRDYAHAMFALIKPLVPHACEAFKDYRLKAIALSLLEIEAIQERRQPDTDNKRELEEWEEKRKLLRLPPV